MNWISTKDKEPPMDTMVLICWSDAPDIDPEMDYMTVDEDLNGFWANYNGDEPTHWMPLPAPPSTQAKYDWSNIPSWVEWIATSPDYKAWGFTHEPKICGDNDQDWGLRQEDSWSDVVAVSKFKGSWKDSLEQRPK